MLTINTEFRKGILFVRLEGILSDDTCDNLRILLDDIIGSNNVCFVVFNIEKLNYIDLDGINLLIKYNKLLEQKKGRALVCGISNELVKIRITNTNMLDYMFETSDELGAINVINL